MRIIKSLFFVLMLCITNIALAQTTSTEHTGSITPTSMRAKAPPDCGAF